MNLNDRWDVIKVNFIHFLFTFDGVKTSIFIFMIVANMTSFSCITTILELIQDILPFSNFLEVFISTNSFNV